MSETKKHDEHKCITVGEMKETLKTLHDENATKEEKEIARDFIYGRADNCSNCIRLLNKNNIFET
ncbi:hypothetical protein ACFL1U_02240 [Patescibacteria group bacterium]